MFPAYFISGSRDFTQHLTSGELILNLSWRVHLGVDCVQRKTLSSLLKGIIWIPFSYLEDLDYADDLALQSHTHTHIQEKTQRPYTFAKQVGLHISSNTEYC